MNVKLARGFEPATSARDTLVMRRSLDGDEDQDAEVATVVRNPGRRARCVPDRPVNAGNSRSLADTPACPLTCAQPGLRLAAHVLLSNRSATQPRRCEVAPRMLCGSLPSARRGTGPIYRPIPNRPIRNQRGTACRAASPPGSLSL